MVGKIPWNKGLTKETNKDIKNISKFAGRVKLKI